MGYVRHKHPVKTGKLLLPVLGVGILLSVVLLAFKITAFRQNSGVCPHCNVILITVDTLAARDIDCETHSDRTPNICAFTKDSVGFTRMYAQDTWTLPNLFSVFTSQYVSTHRIQFGTNILNPKIPTLPQTLRNNGYSTIFVGPTDNPHLPLERGMGRGFSTIIPYNSLLDWRKGLDELTRISAARTPVFLYMNTYDSHDSWEMSDIYKKTNQFSPLIWKQIITDLAVSPEDAQIRFSAEDLGTLKMIRDTADSREAARFFDQLSETTKMFYVNGQFLEISKSFPQDQLNELRAVYYNRLQVLDTELADVFDYMKRSGILNKSIVVFTGTHGESFGEHNTFAHAVNNLYDEVVRVPLFISIPGVPSRRIDDLVQSIDLFPTILGLTGIRTPPNLSGIDITGIIRNVPDAKKNIYSISEHGPVSETKSIRTMTRHLVITNDDEATAKLFNVQNDPLELTDVSKQNPSEVNSLHTQLEHILWQQPILN